MRSSLLTVACVGALANPAAAYTLTNGPGDGTVAIVGVDAYGMFGWFYGDVGDEAYYDPVGTDPIADTTSHQSHVSINNGVGSLPERLGAGPLGELAVQPGLDVLRPLAEDHGT